MKKRTLIIIFYTIFCIIILTGCWDRRELNELGIVFGVALDKDDQTGEYLITSQVIRPSAMKTEGGGQKPPVELITSKGATILDAIRNATLQFDKKLFYNHSKVVILSEDIAKEGVTEAIDNLMRDHEMRKSMWIIIAKEKKAYDVLGTIHGIENVQASYLEDIIKLRNVNGKETDTSLLEFYQKLYAQGINPIAGVAEIVDQLKFPIEEKKESQVKGLNLSGTAVFKKDKLVGYLNDNETEGLNWITKKNKNNIFVVPSIKESGKLISIEIESETCNIQPEILDDNYLFDIAVKVSGNVDETEGRTDFTKLENFDKIQEEVNKAIQEQIKAVIDKDQNQFGSDIFGFGTALSKKYPKKWDEIKDNWDNIFPNVKYNVKIDFKPLNSGLLLKEKEPKE